MDTWVNVRVSKDMGLYRTALFCLPAVSVPNEKALEPKTLFGDLNVSESGVDPSRSKDGVHRGALELALF